MPTVLAILADGFEEIEAVAPIDLLRRAGAQVVVAALGDGIHVQGRNGIILHADTRLDARIFETFDCLLLPGGPGVKQLRSDPRVQAVILRHYEAGKIIAAICAAPALLHDAGLLEGRRFTAHPTVAGELASVQLAERVVADGPIITSRGAGTAIDFGLAIVSHLFCTAKAQEISSSVAL